MDGDDFQWLRWASVTDDVAVNDGSHAATIFPGTLYVINRDFGMSVLWYVGFVFFCILLAYAVRWFDPSFIAHMSSQTGLTARKAWAITIVALLWIFFPVLAGAQTGDNELWLAGAAIAGGGFFLATIAVSSLDEYRLLQRVPACPPEQLPAGDADRVVATSGIPEPITGGDRPETPFSGVPAVHTDWMVQRKRQLGLRTVWSNHATGQRSTAFTLGDSSVTVTPGRHRVFTTVDDIFDIEPDADVPEPAATFMAGHPDLPAPDARDAPLRIVESYIPADEPVTVIGHVEQAREPGTARIDEAPVDELLGTHTDNSSSGAGGSEAILIQGTVEQARAVMRKRVRWLGIAGVGMIVGGQAVSFWLSSASLATLL
jgi:hypothetical protein